MNQKNSLGLNKYFMDLDNPIELFNIWMNEAKNTELNDPNALALATSTSKNVPSVRIVLLKDFSEKGFIFYTNLNSQKSNELKENPNAAMCFHWKSLLRQVRIDGKISQVDNKVADKYYNSRNYESRIGAWASKQSSILKNRDQLLESIEKYRKKFDVKKEIPRPDHWSGWNLLPRNIEFWLDGENRIHERLRYTKDQDGKWIKLLISP
jgi:pyridoxamine 5'-phosphate oxidase